MEERNIRAKNIIGASAGSIFGFLIAVGVPVSMMKKVLFGEKNPYGTFSGNLDLKPAEERQKELNKNTAKILEAAQGDGSIFSTIYMTIWTLFSLIR